MDTTISTNNAQSDVYLEICFAGEGGQDKSYAKKIAEKLGKEWKKKVVVYAATTVVLGNDKGESKLPPGGKWVPYRYDGTPKKKK